MPKLKISVVIATFNRCTTIPITLQHLANQSLAPDNLEVIVVDDGSTDNTENVIYDLQESLPYNLKYLRHPNRGICYTQNRGILAANASIVCLIADDIFLSYYALEAHIKAHESNLGHHIAVLGKVVQSIDVEMSVFLKNWDPFKFRHLKNLKELPYYLFWACNITVKRDFLLKNGMFSETLVTGGTNAHEDAELGYRLSKSGLRIIYCENALGYHNHIVTLEKAVKAAYQRGLNWASFRKMVNKPEITVRYHVLNKYTLKDYIETFRNPDSANNLIGADKNPFLLAIRQIVYAVLFNFITVPYMWLPLVNIAEKNSFVALFMHRELYRGVISYHFFKGVSKNIDALIQIYYKAARG